MRQIPSSGVLHNDRQKSSHLDSSSVGARVGDICAFIVPSYTEAQSIRSQLTALQLRYGGEAAELKLLSQRFRTNATQFELLKLRLNALARATAPLGIMGERVEPFYSTFHEQEILKCHVRRNKALEVFFEQFTQVLLELNIKPQVQDMPKRLTLLEDVHMKRLQQEGYRRLLFVGQRITLAKVKAPGHHTELFSVAFSRALPPGLPISD